MNFITWKAMVDIGFWSRLTKKKIQQYKLDASQKPLVTKFRLTNKPDKISILSINAYSFGDTIQQQKSGPVEYYVQGKFINFNTIQQYQNVNLQQEEQKLMDAQWEKIKKFVNGQHVEFFSQIKMFIFGDFKKHLFSYQIISPAIPVEDYKVLNASPACQFFAQAQRQSSLKKLNNFVKQYCVTQKKSLPQLTVLKNLQQSTIKQFINNPNDNYLFCITDSSNYQKHTGHHTSTILSLFSYLRQNGQGNQFLKINVLLMKEFLVYGMEKNYPFKTSEIYTLDLSQIKRAGNQKRISMPIKNMDLDLKSFMDDRALMDEAVNLNIKLMKWRLLPSLNIEKINTRKCLLFGAGTLGCQLARNLIGWGIKNITFIDYSTVSYSNPVRQTLYEFQDTVKGGKPKAQTAAQKLIKIYPSINAKGLKLRIPMPGHYVTKQQHIKQTFQSLDTLQELVKEHDVIFLLLDSREARWLPTVLANKYDKACITVGLGFDSFVIVRHGVSPDIFNPDRTLDQQCTVTRPGLSFLASSYASQLYISLLHHPLQHRAPANEQPQKLQTTELGKLPHHIRGNMSDFQTHLFYGRAFDKCVACSDYILKQYNNNREQFMLKVLNDPSFIHEVVQLKQELEQFNNMDYNIIQIVDEDFVEIGANGKVSGTEQEQKKQGEDSKNNTNKQQKNNEEQQKKVQVEVKQQKKQQQNIKKADSSSQFSDTI